VVEPQDREHVSAFVRGEAEIEPEEVRAPAFLERRDLEDARVVGTGQRVVHALEVA
jgi:hypothetical protein